MLAPVAHTCVDSTAAARRRKLSQIVKEIPKAPSRNPNNNNYPQNVTYSGIFKYIRKSS